ncbi:Pyruvate carboxylase [Pseudonocardia dioxanivorans CB1190]|uniref:biotin carboxylase n=1 Tax=Pseudonocardia dioxanivorans (strain ATCC 55486 / DSM 44775 / JCM 13855 / CB1190) TaxID=675635 RepID=F4CRE0_PSEUX|nr:acetyl-CoA carboxylase biotin carboxylase subunit [Pseudonocardia dioxanivorans]AEA25231.1 Pyruvate carboxylase [Pseudonocardia dioxanivorans CB1190]
MSGSIRRVLVANRGEIAVRIVHACRELGIETVLAVSEADRDSLGARLADRAVCIGPPRAPQSYLDVARIVTAAVATGCDAVHPGYGFLSESPALARACTEHGLTFVGPTAAQLEAMGDKISARRLAREAGVPTLPGSEQVRTPQEALAVAREVGLPLIVKASAGGGGRGMKVVSDVAELPSVLTTAAAEAAAAFGDPTLYVERFVRNARHVEVQVLGDRHGHVVHLGERDCSLQRRNQKVVEEAPAPGLPLQVRDALHAAAVRLARRIGYESAGTVEFVLDRDTGEFFFLEMNTRIQVEHPVTELVTGIDLVQQQLRVAAGEPLAFGQCDVVHRGHAIECRITAEVPSADFRPDAGRITAWDPPGGPNVRVDTHCVPGYLVPVYYDSLLAKLIVYAPTRAEAIARARSALRRFGIEGVRTTVGFLDFLVGRPEFADATMTTHTIADALGEFAPADAA